MEARAPDESLTPDWAPPAGTVFHRRMPSAGLRHLVLRYSGYGEAGGPPMRQDQAASLIVTVVVSFGERFRIGLGVEPGETEFVPSFVSGLFAGPVHIRSTGRAACLQIDFTPLGARRFLRAPMHDFTGQMVPLDALTWPDLDVLVRRLEDEPRWERRFDIAERFVAARLAEGPEPSAGVMESYVTLLQSHGTVRVEEMARTAGWSRKHLTHRFHEEIGLPPKQVAGIVRFANALHLSRQSTAPDWADIALACGYADQAHMIRAFRRLAGSTPSAWRARTGA